MAVTPAIEPEPAAPAAVEIASPVEKRRAIVDALVVEDFQALVEAMGSADDLARMAQDRQRDLERAKEPDYKPSEAEIAIDGVLAKLATREGVDALVAEWQPLLAEQANAKVIEFNLGLAAMMSALGEDKSASVEELRQRGQLILAVQAWANGVDFNDAARLRRAVDAAAGFVRKSGVRSSRDFMAMPFEDLVIRLDDALRAGKEILAAYDLDVDALLRSIEFSVVSRDGDRARIRTEATVLGVRLSHEEELRWYMNDWMDAGAVDSIERWEGEHPDGAGATEAQAEAQTAAVEAAAEPELSARQVESVPSCKAPADTATE
jgi:hypothetical protein